MDELEASFLARSGGQRRWCVATVGSAKHQVGPGLVEEQVGLGLAAGGGNGPHGLVADFGLAVDDDAKLVLLRGEELVVAQVDDVPRGGFRVEAAVGTEGRELQVDVVGSNRRVVYRRIALRLKSEAAGQA